MLAFPAECFIGKPHIFCNDARGTVGGRITIWGVYTIQLIRYAEDVGGENEACYLNIAATI